MHMAQQGLSTAPHFLFFLSTHYSLSSGPESRFPNESIWLAQPLGGAPAWANQLSQRRVTWIQAGHGGGAQVS